MELDGREQRSYLGTKWDTLSDAEQDAKLITKSKMFMTSPHAVCLVALAAGEIIGFLLALHIGSLESLRVEYIVTEKSYQKQGVATRLYKELFAYAAKKNIKRIEALINTDNPRSVKLHKKVGFDLKPRMEAVYLVKG